MDSSHAPYPIVDETSDPFVGQWRRLVSTTNWQKGRIISEWREALISSGAKSQAFSDETWSRTVGGVTPQHVGRLRRVYERFHESHATYPGLYWSHFHSAVDWEDAEMWLEGAVQNGWSVSHMRRQRWETLGGDEPLDNDVVLTEVNEDLASTPTIAENTILRESLATLAAPRETQLSADNELETAGAPWSEEAPSDSGTMLRAISPPEPPEDASVRPFEQQPTLPEDLTEAFESLKLVILRHKLAGWRATSPRDVLSVLEAYKLLVTAP